MLSRKRLHGGGDRLNEQVELHDLPLQMDLPLVGAGQSQEITDEAAQPSGYGMNRAKDTQIVFWREDLQERQVGFAANDGDWRTQFVRGIRDKASLAHEGLLKVVNHLIQGQRELVHFILRPRQRHTLPQ